MALHSKSYLPFIGVEHEFLKTLKVGKKTRRFRVFTYQAYSAFGLIGPENNGVAICDEDRNCVVIDELEAQDSGYFGASRQQIELLQRLAAMSQDDFIAFVNADPNDRLRDPHWL